MTAKIAIVFGAVMLLAGVLGFVPAAAPDGHLLGIFHVDPVHNMVHLLTGVVALISGFAGVHVSRIFFRAFGVVYGLVAVLGFIAGDQPLFGIMANNIADAWLHVGIAVVSLLLGFATRDEPHLAHHPA